MEHEQEKAREQREVILRIERVSKTYAVPNGRLQVLRDARLEVRRGEFIAITGQSGSGKTTLLSLLGALDSPDSGEIWLNDLRCMTCAARRLPISGAKRSGLCSNSFICCPT